MSDSLIRRVANAVHDRGEATWRDLAPMFPGKTGTDLSKCLTKAAGHGWLRIERPSTGPGRKAEPALFRAVQLPQGFGAPRLPRVSCVWDLATGRTVKVPQGKGRRFQPLGEW